MKKGRLIPFRLMPGSFGLRGKAYAKAEAEYYLDGYDLERRILEIDFQGEELTNKLLDLDVRYGRKSAFEAACLKEGAVTGSPLYIRLQIEHGLGDAYELHRQLANTMPNEEDRQIALLEVDLDFKKISDIEFEKQCATIRNEPWVGVVDSGYDPSEGVNGLFIEFDWNDMFISYLRENGYRKGTDDEIVNHWFHDLNKEMIADEYGDLFVQNARRRDNQDGTVDHF